MSRPASPLGRAYVDVGVLRAAVDTDTTNAVAAMVAVDALASLCDVCRGEMVDVRALISDLSRLADGAVSSHRLRRSIGEVLIDGALREIESAILAERLDPSSPAPATDGDEPAPTSDTIPSPEPPAFDADAEYVAPSNFAHPHLPDYEPWLSDFADAATPAIADGGA